MESEYECRDALLQRPFDFYAHVVDNVINVRLGVKEKETVEQKSRTLYVLL